VFYLRTLLILIVSVIGSIPMRTSLVVVMLTYFFLGNKKTILITMQAIVTEYSPTLLPWTKSSNNYSYLKEPLTIKALKGQNHIAGGKEAEGVLRTRC